MSDPQQQRRASAEQRESRALELGAETIKDLEPHPDDADGVRGGSDNPLCHIPVVARL
ncbi:MAG: hypothetical protein ACTHMY_02005 [Solirubrobacteraceae bacterium]